MEFLEENNFLHLLSLINIEMNPLRRRSQALLQGRRESSPAPQWGFVLLGTGSAKTEQGTSPGARSWGRLRCLCIWGVHSGHRRQRSGACVVGVRDGQGLLPGPIQLPCLALSAPLQSHPPCWDVWGAAGIASFCSSPLLWLRKLDVMLAWKPTLQSCPS